MKILLFGASGSGTTTLGQHLAERLECPHLDVDDYYWIKTNPPFQHKVTPGQRNAMLIQDFEKNKNVVVSGSLVSWGNYWITAFDLAVFLYLSADIRMERLEKRELERYGDLLTVEATTMENSKAFLDWARRYDDDNFKGRSKRIHEQWMSLLNCLVLRLDGGMELDEKINRVLAKIPSSW